MYATGVSDISYQKSNRSHDNVIRIMVQSRLKYLGDRRNSQMKGMKLVLLSSILACFISNIRGAQEVQPSQLLNNTGGCIINHLDDNLQILNSVNLSIYQSGANIGNVSSQVTSIGIECSSITAEQLHDQFNRIKILSPLKVASLSVRDSNLTNLSSLPQGTHELKRMVISNTSIDLEVLREGSESLDQLTTLEIKNEKISNIPHNFFQEMQSLKELRLENDEIASLDGDAFYNLDDSLEILDLKKNRFNRFPMAVKNLAQLAVLDLTDNDIVIDTQENDLPDKLEPLLNLRELSMNRINCTCEFGSSPFFEWIARTHIYGVRCFAPEKLRSQEVIVFERDEFCTRTTSSGATSNIQLLESNFLTILLVVSSAFTAIINVTSFNIPLPLTG